MSQMDEKKIEKWIDHLCMTENVCANVMYKVRERFNNLSHQVDSHIGINVALVSELSAAAHALNAARQAHKEAQDEKYKALEWDKKRKAEIIEGE